MRHVCLCLLLTNLSLCSPLHAEEGRWLFVSRLQAQSIETYERDREAGKLTHRHKTSCPAEPAIMIASPDRQTLFVSFRSSGELASFRITPQGSLKLLGVAQGGADPAFLLPDATGRFLIAAYYVQNMVTIHKVDASGTLQAEPYQIIQTAKNAHGIAIDSENRHVYVTHTGGNSIFQFLFDAESGKLSANAPPFVRAAAGEHPRHIGLHPSGKWAYVNNEAGDSLSVYNINHKTGGLVHLQTVGTLPDDFDGTNNSTARSELTRNGRFVYVANRGHHSIAAFAIDQTTGQVTPLGQTPTEKTPRSFTIDADSRFLYSAGQDSGRIATYSIAEDGRLQPRETTEVGLMPWCVLAVDRSETD